MVAQKTLSIMLTAFASIGGFLYGYDTGVLGGIKAMQPFLATFGEFDAATGLFILPTGTDALITSILSAGTFVGALAASSIGDRLGRRYGIIAFLAVFALGVALQTGGTSIATFVAGRIFAGLGVGGTSALVPMYQSEVAPANIRGALVSSYQLCITIGILVSAIAVNGTKDIATSASWQIPTAIQFIWGAILAVGLFFLPESPRWLILKGKDQAALVSLSRLLAAPADSAEVQQEFEEISVAVRQDLAQGQASYADCFRNGPGRHGFRMWTGIGVQALQQLTGVNFIFYYGTQFFLNSGIKEGFTITIITCVVNTLSTIPGMYAMDRLGRRFLLMYGAFGMAVSQLIVAIVGNIIKIDNVAGQRVLIAFVCVFIAHFAATWGCLAWVVTSEIYPTTIRSRAMGMSTASNWLLNFAIGYSTPYLVNQGPGNAALGSNVFYIWGGCCVLGFFFSYFMVPETRGLSLEQIDLLYRNSSIRGSNAYRQKILAEDLQLSSAGFNSDSPKLSEKPSHEEDIKV